MKHVTALFAFLFVVKFLAAQGIALDSTFGNNGYIKTPLYTNSSTYSSIMDLTPDNQIALTARGRSSQSGLLFCKYSTSGDSVKGYHFPNDFLNYNTITAIKSLQDGGFLVTDYEKGKGLKRINQDGTVDQDFGTNGGASLFYNGIEDILISRDSQILLAGENLNDYDGELAGAYVLAYDMEGHLDSTFGDHGRFRYHYNWLEFFNKMIQQPDGKILVAGCALSETTPGFNTLFRLLPNGTLDSTFGVNGLVSEHLSTGGENYGLVLQPDQKMLICGYDHGLHSAIIIRYLPNGARDASFGNNGVVALSMVSEATDLTLLPNGKILAYCAVPDADYHSALIQLMPDGSLDPFFGYAGVFYNPMAKFAPPLKMKLVDGNKLIVTGSIRYYTSTTVSTYLQLQAYTLDLSVGVVSPQNKPSFWTYPNPVQEHFDIGFELQSSEEMQFDLYDLQGKHIQNVVPNSLFEPGSHSVPINLTNGLSAGNYLLRLSSAGKPLATVQVLKI